jgi:hypothetical protein
MQNGTLTATYGYDSNGNRNSVATPSGTQSASARVPPAGRPCARLLLLSRSCVSLSDGFLDSKC